MVHNDKLAFWHVLISNECGFRTWKKKLSTSVERSQNIE